MSDNINVKVNETGKEITEVIAPAEAKDTKELTRTVAESLESRVAPEDEKAAEKLTPEYIMAQIEKLIADRFHITQALAVLSSASDSYAAGDIAGQARFTAIADVVKCRETTIQQALSFYRKLYDEFNSPLDIALAQAERILRSPVSDDFDKAEIFDPILNAFTASLQSKKGEESSLEFKRRAIMEHVRCQQMSPEELAELFAVLDD